MIINSTKIIAGVEYDINCVSLLDNGLSELCIVDADTGEIVATVIQGNPGSCTISARALIAAGGGEVFVNST